MANLTDEEKAKQVLLLRDPKFYLESFCKIKGKTPGLIPFILNNAQKDFFNTLRKANRVMALKARQLGFSTAIAGFLYHKTITSPGTTTALVAHKAEVAAEFLDKVKTFWRTTPESLRPQIHYNSKYEISFPALDSKIMVMSGDNVGRGFTIHNAHLSEMAMWDRPEAMMDAIENAVPVNGQIIIESCVTADTLLLTEKGPMYMKDVFDWDTAPLGFSDGPILGLDGHYGTKTTNKYYKSGKREGFKIITRSGNELSMSSVHKMFVLKNGTLEFVEAKDLQPGDYLAQKYGQNLWGDNDIVDWIPTKYSGLNKQNIKLFNPGVIDVDLAYLIGLIIGDGYVDFKNGRVVITTQDEEIANFLLEFPSLKFYKSKDDIHYVCKNKSFVEFLDWLGMKQVKAPQKTIPQKAMQWSRANLINLLSGLFDADGSVNKNKSEIVFVSTSRLLVREVSLLLSNLGILSRIYSFTTKPTKKVKVFSHGYRLEINSGNSALFGHFIGFRLSRKQEKINLRANLAEHVLPGVGHYLKEHYKEIGLTYYDILCASNKGLYSKSGAISYSTLKTILDKSLNQNHPIIKGLRELITYNYRYDEVVDKQPIREDVYDFHVPDGNTVTYNSLVGHQTPMGVGNLYHRMWAAKDNGYVKKEYGWWWHYTEEEMDLIRKRIGDPLRIAQEYELEFLASGRQVFNPHLVRKLQNNILEIGHAVTLEDGTTHFVKEDEDGLRIYKPPQPGHLYVVGADVAEGVVGGDYSVAVIYDRRTGEEVGFYRGHIAADKFGLKLNKWGRLFNDALMVVEINNHGLTTITALKNALYPAMYFRPAQFDRIGTQWSDRLGWKTTRVTRPLMIDDLNDALREDSITLHSKETIDEMVTFIFDGGNNMVSMSGFHDDGIFASAIGFQGFKVMYQGELEQVNYEEHLPNNYAY